MEMLPFETIEYRLEEAERKFKRWALVNGFDDQNIIWVTSEGNLKTIFSDALEEINILKCQ